MGNAGQQLKKLRLHFNMTQQQFADAVSIKRNSISMIESGRNKPTFDLISDICGVFNLPADYFLTGDNPEAYSNYFKDIKTKIKVIKNVIGNKNDKEVELQKSTLVEDQEISISLNRLANAHLMYLEFHLADVFINMKLLHENLSKQQFDRKEFDKSNKKLIAIFQTLKEALNSGKLNNNSLAAGLVTIDEGFKYYLDNIRDLSKDLLVNFSK